MLSSLSWLLIGILFGVIITVKLTGEPETPVLFTPQPDITIVNRNIVTAFAMCEVPQESMICFDDYVEQKLKHELANQIWRYAEVYAQVDALEHVRRYKAILRVVDSGNMNPFLEDKT